MQITDGDDAVEEAEENSKGIVESTEEKMSNAYHSPKHGEEREFFGSERRRRELGLGEEGGDRDGGGLGRGRCRFEGY
ncbi:hypothetical protein SLA2020_269030 [Shorea laevis]